MHNKNLIVTVFFSVIASPLIAMEPQLAPLSASTLKQSTLLAAMPTPNIRLDPLGDGKSSLELLRVSGNDLDIVNAARVSYNKHSDAFSPADESILKLLISSGHETPFEQTFLQFHVKLPIFVARQWMRHRVGVSYNEQSARYTKMAQEFYMPVSWRSTHTQVAQLPKQEQTKLDTELRAIYENALAASSQAYEKLLAKGVVRELARGVLPVSLYTQFVFACNIRSLFHFAQLRADSHAQWEIQQYAKGMIKLAYKNFPVSIALWCKTHNITWLEEQH